MQDIGYWEAHGLPSVAVSTTAFLRQAKQQVTDLGLDGVCYTCVPHPVQGLSEKELESRLEDVFAHVLQALEEDGFQPPVPPATAASAEEEAAWKS